VVLPYRFAERRSATPVRRIVCHSEEAAPHRLLPKSEEPLQLHLYQRLEDLAKRRERQLGASGLGFTNILSGCTGLVITRAILPLVITRQRLLSTAETAICS
jgi:hypothetical protein